VPYEEAYEAGVEDMRRRVPDISKIRQYVDWKPDSSLDKILLDVVRDFAGSS
jgi:UDP-glucose 4-epimerase